METGFTRLPRYARVGAVAALAAAPVLVFRLAWVRPQVRALDEKRATLARKQADLAQARRDQAALTRFRARVDDLTLRLGRLDAALPEPEEVSALLRRLQTFAVRSGLTIRAFRPRPPVARDLHTEWSYRLRLDGTYRGLAGFFDRIGRLSRVVRIDDVVIRAAAAQEPGHTITAECTATTFVLDDAPESDPRGPEASRSPAVGRPTVQVRPAKTREEPRPSVAESRAEAGARRREAARRPPAAAQGRRMERRSRIGGVPAAPIATDAAVAAADGTAAQDVRPAREAAAGHEPDGRRDPFVSPVAPSAAPREERPGGLSGLAVDEATLRGVVRNREGWVALVEASDGRTYAVRPGDRLYDGTVREITGDAVVFRRDAADPVGEREVRKRLRAGESAP